MKYFEATEKYHKHNILFGVLLTLVKIAATVSFRILQEDTDKKFDRASLRSKLLHQLHVSSFPGSIYLHCIHIRLSTVLAIRNEEKIRCPSYEIRDAPKKETMAESDVYLKINVQKTMGW